MLLLFITSVIWLSDFFLLGDSTKVWKHPSRLPESRWELFICILNAFGREPLERYSFQHSHRKRGQVQHRGCRFAPAVCCCSEIALSAWGLPQPTFPCTWPCKLTERLTLKSVVICMLQRAAPPCCHLDCHLVENNFAYSFISVTKYRSLFWETLQFDKNWGLWFFAMISALYLILLLFRTPWAKAYLRLLFHIGFFPKL